MKTTPNTQRSNSHISSFCITSILILLLALPARITQAEPEPEPEGAVVGCLLVVVVVGGIIVYGVWKICDRAFPNPPRTNAPPTNIVKTVDGILPEGFSMRIESCTNLTDPNWVPAGYTYGSFANGRVLFVTTDLAGTPIMTNDVAAGSIFHSGDYVWIATNDVREVIRSQGEPQKFWRIQ